MKDFYLSMNQNSEHLNQDSSLRWNKTRTEQKNLTLEQQKSNSWTPVGRPKTVYMAARMQRMSYMHAS